MTDLADILKTRFDKDYLVSYLKENPDQFNRALIIAISDEQPEAWRAAWVINHCIKHNDSRINKIANKIIKKLKTKEDGHQRELLKILENVELNENQEGYLFDICMTIWESIEKSPSVRIVAFRSLVKIVKKYPELKNEIEYLTRSHYTEKLSPGIKNSFMKIKKELLQYPS